MNDSIFIISELSWERQQNGFLLAFPSFWIKNSLPSWLPSKITQATLLFNTSRSDGRVPFLRVFVAKSKRKARLLFELCSSIPIPVPVASIRLAYFTTALQLSICIWHQTEQRKPPLRVESLLSWNYSPVHSDSMWSCLFRSHVCVTHISTDNWVGSLRRCFFCYKYCRCPTIGIGFVQDFSLSSLA